MNTAVTARVFIDGFHPPTPKKGPRQKKEKKKDN
jgi:hypothetical protein